MLYENILVYPEFVQASLDTLNIRIFIEKFLGKILEPRNAISFCFQQS